MGRYSEPLSVHADWWDPDEGAEIKTKLSFGSAQRVAFHQGQIKNVDVNTASGAADAVTHMTAVLFETLQGWTLRKPGTPYKEGLDRPVWEFTLENIGEQPVDDVAYLFVQAMAIHKKDDTPPESDLITPAAAKEGL